MVQVGVGCFVVNEHNEVLVVQERSGPLRGKGMTHLLKPRVQRTAKDIAKMLNSLHSKHAGGLSLD